MAENKAKKTRNSEEIKKDFREYQKTKDQKLRDKLIEEHLYIAEILAKKYINRGIDYDDLYQVASIGLILAIDRYDVDKGFEFSSYATPTIIGEIKRYFRDKGWVIRVPRRIQELSKKVNLARSSLNQELLRPPTLKEIADYLKISEEEVIEAMEASQVYTPQSLDASYEATSSERELNLADFLGVEDKSYEEIEFNDFLKDLLSHLTEAEKIILMGRHYEKRTQISIAKQLGISQMTVSRMEKKLLDKIRKEMNIKSL